MALFCAACVTACTPHELDVVDCRAACGGSGRSGAGSGGAPSAGTTSGAGGAGANLGGLAGESGDGGSGAAGSTAFPDTLVHRYDFEGTGTAVFDRVGIAHGALIGTELGTSDGRGAAILAGRNSGQYVELPRGIVSKLANATFEAWVTWSGQGVWERIFDFGDAIRGDNGEWYGANYLFLTPRAPFETGGVLRSAQQRGAPPEFILDADRALPVNVRAHVALVVDNEHHILGLFLDGKLLNQRAIVDSPDRTFDLLATLNDENNWLGRSLYEQDAFFGGTFHEFRIYGAALTAAEIEASYARGPDPELGD